MKAIKEFSIKNAIEEIMTIQQYKADSLSINMISEFVGFEASNKGDAKIGRSLDFTINSDEMRMK